MNQVSRNVSRVLTMVVLMMCWFSAMAFRNSSRIPSKRPKIISYPDFD